MGMIKYKNGKDLTEAENIKKKWQEYAEELYKKDLHSPDNHDGVITDLEPDILECEVKWALKASLWTKLVEVMIKFKGLDLIEWVPEELWMEVHNIVQEAVTKTIPKKNKYKKAK